MTPANQSRRHFASDNWAGVHPEVIAAISAANTGHDPSYGKDDYTRSVANKLKAALGNDSAEVFFVFGGTAANVLGLETLARPFNGIICAETAHIHTSECGAAEKHIGCKLVLIPTTDGKIDREGIARHLNYFGNEHHVQPSVVSISQATEYGTVYNADEIRVIASYVHEHGMKLHMDGARLANAAASLGVSLADITGGAGVDVLSFGGTKNGLIAAEAVVFFDAELARGFEYRRMQGMQLSSKMRFIAAQFDALLTDELWKRSAQRANHMASLLGKGLDALDGFTVTQKVEANEVFAIVPRDFIAPLQSESFFLIWDEVRSEARFVTSFDTEESDIVDFVTAAKALVTHYPPRTN